MVKLSQHKCIIWQAVFIRWKKLILQYVMSSEIQLISNFRNLSSYIFQFKCIMWLLSLKQYCPSEASNRSHIHKHVCTLYLQRTVVYSENDWLVSESCQRSNLMENCCLILLSHGNVVNNFFLNNKNSKLNHFHRYFMFWVS